MIRGSKFSKDLVWIEALMAEVKDKEKVVAKCIKKFGVDRREALNKISYLERQGRAPVPVAPKKKISSAKVSRGGIMRLSVDVSEIKREYDEEAKILEGIEMLGTRLIKDNDFRMELSVPIDRWKVVTGMAKFQTYRKELKGKRFKGIYWGSPDVIKQLAKTIEML